MPKVVITMPAYHAEGTLEQTVADIPEGVADELILVDDASGDRTVEVARAMGIDVYVHPRNRGYGGNQKSCYTRALERGADVVVLLHPDYQYDPKAVPLLIAPILAGRADMTFGSRFAAQGDPRAGGMPAYRFYGNRLTTIAENLFLGTRFTEMHSGLRAYSRDCLLRRPFLSYSDDFFFDSQFLIDAVMADERVVEIPIPTRYTKESSSISIVRSLRYVALSVLYAARARARLGRRGRRSPVTFDGRRRGRPLGRPVAARSKKCVLCGNDEMRLIYPANVTGGPQPAEFACTAPGLARHDDILQCRHCGMVSSDPPMSPAEIESNYEEMADDDYLSEEAARRELFGWILDRVEAYPLPEKELLEVGSNVGLFLDVASERGWKARGIEPSRWAVETGRREFGVDIEQGTIADLEETQQAHTIVMLDVLEHLNDPLGDLRRLRAVVTRDGLLALSTIDVSGIHARARKGSWPWFIRPHLHYFTPETLDAMLHRAGFDLVQWAVVPRSFHVSYVARRAWPGRAGAALDSLTKFGDPRVPLGWLGDVVFAVARPRGGESDDERGEE